MIQSNMPDYIYVCRSKPNNKGKGLLRRIINNRNFDLSVRRFDFPGKPNIDIDVSVSMLDGGKWVLLPVETENDDKTLKITWE